MRWSLGLFLGSIAVIDLRLLGVGLRHEPVAEVARRLLPWTWTGYSLMALSGGLVFWSADQVLSESGVPD